MISQFDRIIYDVVVVTVTWSCANCGETTITAQ